jgi:WD40-like Beta Propeller Repeat
VKQNSRSVLKASVTVLLAAACSSGAPPQAVAPETAPAGPLPGDNYVIAYQGAGGLHLQDTRTGADSVLLPADEVLEVHPSPGGGAFAAVTRRGDSSRVVLVESAVPRIVTMHRGAAGGTYSLRWSTDGQSLGLGYAPPGSATAAASSAIVVVERVGAARNVGCRTASEFFAWRGDGDLVVGDPHNVYVVRAEGCETVATLPKTGKSELTFSANGTKVAFLRDNRAGQPELWIANADGSGAQIAGPWQYHARQARWAPDGSKIAFTLQSQQYGNVTHVAVHDLSTGRATFDAEPRDLGLPSDEHPCWSPRGTWLAVDRSYQRSGGGQAYVTRQKVVAASAGGKETVVAEALLRGSDADSWNPRCGWMDENHLLIGGAAGMSVIDVRTRKAYQLQASGVLHVTVVAAKTPSG